MASTGNAAGSRFMRERMNSAAKKYAKRSATNENTIASHIATLENLVSELQRKYATVVNQSAVLQPLSVSIAPSENVSEESQVLPPQGNTREEILESMTWEELSTTAHVLAENKYQSQMTTLEKIQSAVLFPQFFTEEAEDSRVLDDGAYTQLLIAPYFIHYKNMRLELVEIGRELQQKRDQLARNSTLQVDITTAVVPSEWMADFLYVFHRAKTVGTQGYPTPRELEDVFYTTKIVRRITEGHNTVSTQLRSYAFDIGYHCVRFASLFTTLPFNPVNDLNMKPTLYTDFELLVHFAMRTAKNDVKYEDFLINPSLYLSGSKYAVMKEAVNRAVREIISSFEKGLYFKANNNYGVELMKRTQSPSGDTYSKETAVVPDNIMVGLCLDVLDNRILYERRKEMAVFGGLRKLEARDMRVESPIGRLLNFDERSVAEFETMYKRLEPRRPELVNAQLSDRIASFRCVHRVYAMLVSAAATVFAMRVSTDSTLPVSFVIDRCMRYDPDTGAVMYASTAEAFPGLLFYTMLASPAKWENFEKIDSKKATDTVQPGISDPTYFANRPDRRAFFDTFGCYAFRVESITKAKVNTVFPIDVNATTEGIRWMTNVDLSIIRASIRKQLAEAQSAFISLLAFNANLRNSSLWLKDTNILAYFKDQIAKDGTCKYRKLTSFHENYVDTRAFFALPVMYSARADLIDTSKLGKITTEETSGHRLVDILQQINTQPTDAANREEDVSRFIIH